MYSREWQFGIHSLQVVLPEKSATILADGTMAIAKANHRIFKIENFQYLKFQTKNKHQHAQSIKWMMYLEHACNAAYIHISLFDFVCYCQTANNGMTFVCK